MKTKREFKAQGQLFLKYFLYSHHQAVISVRQCTDSMNVHQKTTEEPNFRDKPRGSTNSQEEHVCPASCGQCNYIIAPNYTQTNPWLGSAKITPLCGNNFLTLIL